MIAVVRLGAQLAATTRAPRLVAILGGTAVAEALLLTTAGVPAALYGAQVPIDAQERARIWAVLAFSAVPALVLLLTSTRASAAARDRRLAALRLLGLSAPRTAVVAATENGLQALVGALAGVGVFLVAAPVVTTLVGAGPGWFQAPLRATTTAALLSVAGVVAASAVLSVLSVRSLLTRPITARSEAAPRPQNPWRLTLLAVAVLVLTPLAAFGSSTEWMQTTGGLALLSVGAIAGALAIYATTPLVMLTLARRLGTRAGPATLLAARSVENEPGSTARLVAGLGVTVYLVIAALTVLTAYEATPQYRYAAQTIGDGPQVIHVTTTQGEAISARDLTVLANVPGVDAVVPTYSSTHPTCTTDGCAPRAFIGTCDDLTLVMAVADCHDDRAALITSTESTVGAQPPLDPDPAATPGTLALAVGPREEVLQVRLGPALIQDAAATARRWVYPSTYEVFVPRSLVQAAGLAPDGADVIAGGGTDVQRAVALAVPTSLTVTPYPLWDYGEVMRVRTAITTLCALCITIGLLSLAMTAADRALEHRHTVARLVAVGIPPRTLRAAQLQQTLTPLVAATLLAGALGALLARAFAAIAGWPALTGITQLALVLTANVIGAALVATTTLPLLRTRLTADLLRRE